MTLNNVETWIEGGKQIGYHKEFSVGGNNFWVTFAIQKNNLEYIAHVTLINEKNMAMEKYDLYETRAFSSVASAFEFFSKKGGNEFKYDLMRPFKGQKAFRLDSEEIER